MKRVIKMIGVLALIAMMLAGGAAQAETQTQAQSVETVETVGKKAAKKEKKAKKNKKANKEKKAEEASEATAEFTGSVTVKMSASKKLYYGDTVKLKATVKKANVDYTLQWQFNDGNGWTDIKGENAKTYSFVVNEKNAGYDWRVAVIVQ